MANIDELVKALDNAIDSYKKERERNHALQLRLEAEQQNFRELEESQGQLYAIFKDITIKKDADGTLWSDIHIFHGVVKDIIEKYFPSDVVKGMTEEELDKYRHKT